MLPRQYVEAISPRLSPEMFEPVPSRAVWVPVHAIIIAAGTLAIVDAHLDLLLRFAVSIVLAFSFARIAILGHEILHGAVLERFWQRRILGAVCLAPLGIGPVFWTIWHNLHHANVQHPVRDPDTWGRLDHIPQDRAMGWLRRFANSRSLLFPFLLATGVTGHAAALLVCMQKQMPPTASCNAHGIWCPMAFLGWAGFVAGMGKMDILLPCAAVGSECDRECLCRH